MVLGAWWCFNLERLAMAKKDSTAFPVVFFFSPDTYFHPICRSLAISCAFISQNRLPGSEVEGLHLISPGSQAEDEKIQEAAGQQLTSPLVTIAKLAC